jgi:RHS repeat-associated protein
MTGLSRYGDLAGTASVADTSYAFDAVGRLTSLKHQRGVATLASYGLAYDAANRITRSEGTDGTQDYTYDATNQLTAVDHTTQVDEAYSYDANGNRTNAGYGTGTNNQLLTDGVYNYSYDDEGNRTRRVEISTGKVTEYVWDYRNRLTSVLFKDGTGVVTKTIEYLYDVSDRRIGKKVDGGTTERYVYDGSDIALVFDGAGSQTHRYLYGTGVDTVLADETGAGVVWALADNQGTIRDVVDGGGVILNHINYDSFGRVVSQTSPSVEFRFGYTGREADSETGLDYYRARYYDASNGRFISEDPIGFAAGDGNLSRYVGNSPVNRTDPSGLDWFSDLKNTVSDPIGSIKNRARKMSIKERQSSFTQSNYLVWKPFLSQAFKGSKQHTEKFMDYYFNGSNNKPPFDLAKEGLLDGGNGIKTITLIKKATNEFERLMENAIDREVKKLKINPNCQGVLANLTLPLYMPINVNVTNENFSLGHTNVKRFALAIIHRDNDGTVSVVDARINYEIYDCFNDAADWYNETPKNEELDGGVGYAITGKWSTGVGKYPKLNNNWGNLYSPELLQRFNASGLELIKSKC